MQYDFRDEKRNRQQFDDDISIASDSIQFGTSEKNVKDALLFSLKMNTPSNE